MKNVIGMFDDAAQARIAEQKVSGLGRIEHLYGRESNALSKLRGYGLSGSELDGFCEGIRRGSTLLVVHCDDKDAQKVADTFRGLPAVDVNRRLGRWKSEGFKGYDEKANFYSDTDIERERRLGANELHVPVIEEQIAVGKREVERGGVRVETHVTEKPFQQNVQLRDEQVRVERHAVNRPVTAADKIGDQVVEMRARGEEAVVSKTAKVVEEVVVTKEGGSHNETIRDTIKRTDVDVKQIAGEKRTSRASLDTDRTSRSSQI